jgi:hypothetical protein
MGWVSIWRQWLGVAGGVLLSSSFAVLLGWLSGGRTFAGYGGAGRWCLGPCREIHLRRAETVGWVPARKLVLLLPNEVVTTGMTDLACAYHAGAVDRAVDD